MEVVKVVKRMLRRTGQWTSDEKTIQMMGEVWVYWSMGVQQAMAHTVYGGNGSITVLSNVSIKCWSFKKVSIVSLTNLNSAGPNT